MILLFNQYFEDKNIVPTMPINLLSLGTYLKSKGLSCKICDFQGLSRYDVKNIVAIEQPKIIGIGAQFTPHFPSVLDMAKHIKSVNPRIKVVIGGNHASSLKKLPPNIDYVVKGEGEVNFYDLCEDILTGKKVEAIREPYSLITNLDNLPMIDYSLVDMKKYTYSSPFFMREPVIGIITSRGCPNDCIYCTVKGVWGRSWRGKSSTRTVDEIEALVKQGYKEFAILDDSASCDKIRWLNICNEIIRRKLDIKWSTPNGIAHWTLTPSVLDRMKKAGCYRITLGIESGNTGVRKFIGKEYPLQQAKEIIKYANKIGMWTITTNVLGFPLESYPDMFDTYKFSETSQTDFAAFYVLDSYPTAAISIWKLDLKLAKACQIQFYRWFMVHRILNFWRVYSKIRSWEDFCYMVKLFWTAGKIFIKTYSKKTTKDILYAKV